MFNVVARSNLAYDRVRLLVGIVGVAFAVLLAFINLGFSGALSETAALLFESLDAEVYLISPLSVYSNATEPFAQERLYQAAANPNVRQAIPLYQGFARWRNVDTDQEFFILGYGFNPLDRPFTLPEVQSDSAIAALQQPSSVLFDRSSLPKYGPPQVGLSTEFNRQNAEISGLFTLGGGMSTEGTILMSDQNFQRFYGLENLDKIDLGLLRLASGTDPQRVVETLRQTLPADVSVYTRAEMIERDRQYWFETTAVGFIFNLGVSVALIVGAATVYQILYADISKNFKEYATLKAIGFRNRFLLNVVLQEAVLLALIGFVPGLLLSLLSYQLIMSWTGGAIPMLMPIGRVFLVCGLTVVTCVLSGLLSIRKIMLADPAGAL
ncbi:MAG: ABC transporter permease DevC [Cyanobacteria bacterium J06614_10]